MYIIVKRVSNLHRRCRPSGSIWSASIGLVATAFLLLGSPAPTAATTSVCATFATIVCLGGNAVLDRSTALVWRIGSANGDCAALGAAGAWRSPTGAELADHRIRSVFDLGRATSAGSLCVNDTLVNILPPISM